jgi:hypothetical protein
MSETDAEPTSEPEVCLATHTIMRHAELFSDAQLHEIDAFGNSFVL